MFSSISLISKHTLLFSERAYKSDFYNTKYISSRAQQIDKYLLKTLDNKDINFGFNQEICHNLNSVISNSGIVDKVEFKYIVYPKTNSLHPHFVNSCILTDGFHRILLKRNPADFNNIMLSSVIICLKNCLIKKFHIMENIISKLILIKTD